MHPPCTHDGIWLGAYQDARDLDIVVLARLSGIRFEEGREAEVGGGDRGGGCGGTYEAACVFAIGQNEDDASVWKGRCVLSVNQCLEVRSCKRMDGNKMYVCEMIATYLLPISGQPIVVATLLHNCDLPYLRNKQ